MFGIVIRTMKKGVKYHANIQDINRAIVIELIRIIIRENNFNYTALFFREHFRPIDFKNAETGVFFKTCNDLLSDWLEVKIDMAEVMRRSSNMSEVVTNLSKCKTKYKIKKEICQQFGFNI